MAGCGVVGLPGKGTGCAGSLNLPPPFLARHPGPPCAFNLPVLGAGLPSPEIHAPPSREAREGPVSSGTRWGDSSKVLTASQNPLAHPYQCLGTWSRSFPAFRRFRGGDGGAASPLPVRGREVAPPELPSCSPSSVAVVSPDRSVLGDKCVL